MHGRAAAARSAALAALLSALPYPTVAQADEMADAIAALGQGTPYATAREKLIIAGLFAKIFPAETAEERCGARKDICNAYPETENCSGTGMGFCLFRFYNPAGGPTFAVTTAGEELKDLTVYGWRIE